MRFKIVKSLVVMLLFIVILACGFYLFTESVCIESDKIYSVDVRGLVVSRSESWEGSAKINDPNLVSDFLRELNAKRVLHLKDHQNETRNPSVWVFFNNQQGDRIDEIYFFDDIVLYKQEFYKLTSDVYDYFKLLCTQYGECRGY